MTSYKPLELAECVDINSESVKTDELPIGLKLNEKAGIVSVGALNGEVIFRSSGKLYEVRGCITPKGDYLVMFPEGEHYAHVPGKKANNMIAIRSKDRGRTWENPYMAFDIDYSQHGFIPLISKGESRIYSFGTQPVLGKQGEGGLAENAPIGYLYSDDDGYTFSGPVLIEPVNDPDFMGMSVTRMCETKKGTWLLGSHEALSQYKPLKTYQYVLRSEDKGKSWEVLPGKRHNGWNIPGFDRMDEGRLIAFESGAIFMLIRTPEGHLWSTTSHDDGRTWKKPASTSLVHPDAPPMVFTLSDKKTLVCFHHNRHHDLDYCGLSGEKIEIMKDRSEIWVSSSTDDGRSWSDAKFLFTNAAKPNLDNPFRDFQCSYLDMFLDNGTVNIIAPHRWQQVLHLTISEKALLKVLAEG